MRGLRIEQPLSSLLIQSGSSAAARPWRSHRYFRLAHGVHAGEQGLHPQRDLTSDRTAAHLYGRLYVVELGVVLRVHRRFRWWRRPPVA